MTDSNPGAGGSLGVNYLEKTRSRKVFPDIGSPYTGGSVTVWRVK